jgi:hypothetical protein
MSKIILPSDMLIVTEVQKQVSEYAREIGLVSAILADHWMKDLYEAQGTGYIAALDTLTDWAIECVKGYAHVEEWEEYLDSDECPYKGVLCWDDFVIRFGAEKMKENNYTITETN